LAGPQAVVVVGEAGIGKTALLRAATADRRAWVGGALSMLSFMPYLPVSRAVGGLPASDEASMARAVISRVGRAGVLVLDDLPWAVVLGRM
jgi:predicted ribonuclease YlaK